MSVALGKLRKLFNNAMFVRTTRGMQATPRASVAVKAARSVLTQIDHELLADDHFDPAVMQRPIVFALSDAGEMAIMPRVLRQLRPAAPNAPTRSVSLPAVEVAVGLESGQIDLAIGYLPDLSRKNFCRQTLFTDTYVSLVRPDHPITSGQLSIEQFQRFDHAVVRAPIRRQELLDRHLARKRIQYRVGFACPHVGSLPSVVAQSDMIMTIPRRLADSFLVLGAALRKVELPFPLPAVEVRQYWHCRFQHDARSMWLRSLIARAFDDQEC